jgi:hypothetical protein
MSVGRGRGRGVKEKVYDRLYFWVRFWKKKKKFQFPRQNASFVMLRFDAYVK